MIDGLSVLALITARGGSKGLPGKNIRLVAGRPLLAWTVDAARQSRFVDRVVLSSDDDAIMAAARACGCEVPFRRPAELATDSAGSVDVALHALDSLPHHDLLVLLQPTSPLRTAADIDAACLRLTQSRAPSCVGVSPVAQSPYWMYQVGEGHLLQPLLEVDSTAIRRQDLPPVYIINGAVYVVRADWLRHRRNFIGPGTVALEMPLERSLDIDDLADFEIFEKAVVGRPHG